MTWRRIEQAVQKVRELCGRVHPMQANIVACNLSQSALLPLSRTLNELIEDAVEDENKQNPHDFDAGDREIATQLRTDANRGIFTINGRNVREADPLVAAFKEAVPGAANRQGLSNLFNQTLPNNLSMLSSRMPFRETGRHPDGAPSDLPGVEKIVSRKAGGKYQSMTINKRPGNAFLYDLKVAEDGRSATMTVITKNHLTAGAGTNPRGNYGSVDYRCVIRIDLAGARPVITDVKLAQTLSETI